MIVGTMALTGTHPRWHESLHALCAHVERVYLRVDTNVAAETLGAQAGVVAGEKCGRILYSDIPWDEWRWREELLRMLDDVQPNIVLNLDEDEELVGDLTGDIERQSRAYCGQMAFLYQHPMPTIDGLCGRSKPYPSKPHVKLFRWREGLTFDPYKGRGRLSNYARDDYLIGASKVWHYCFYTPELRNQKRGLLTTAGKQRWAKKAARKESP